MKKLIVVPLLFLISCGPSKEEMEYNESQRQIKESLGKPKPKPFETQTITVDLKTYIVVYNENGIAITNY